MATKAQKIRLGIFLLSSSAVLLIFFLVLVANKIINRMDVYYIDYQGISVTGLEIGAPVKYHGVQVGRVSGLSVKDVATIHVKIDIEKGTPIRKNTEAILTLIGITGLKFVELIGGTGESEPLPVGGTINAGESIFDTISGRAEIIIAKVESVLNNINYMIGPETTESLRNALVSINNVSSQVDTLLIQNRDHLNNSFANIDTVTISLVQTMEKVDKTINNVNSIVQSKELKTTISNVNDISKKVKSQMDSLQLVQTMDSFRKLVDNSNTMVTHSDLIIVRARDDILKSLSNLEEALDNLREATDVIRENPSVLIRGRQTSGERIE